ncbi:MAG: kdpD [Pseudonocardia sp.]|jgi:two-component system sensor histidine kinase KdpD|nr:kdpD [Pseudonocardia sp.]MDT7613644.1 two-component system, OmpR family, sensor histidine kinase KdpD [Pseudonocardiales bacterium]
MNPARRGLVRPSAVPPTVAAPLGDPPAAPLPTAAARRARRGWLRVYLGAAPGVGKTFAMLAEGRRRADRGTDVVVGFAECHDRPRTEEQLDSLETVPRVTRHYRNGTFTEMDLDAVLARNPEVALVDELAHTNVPGGRHDKRWEDVVELLDAGINVITTVNIQHLESLNDVVEKITGVPQRETVPDDVVRAANQIELVDMSPESLRRRMAHGNIYGPEKVDAALSNYFRVGNLTALRELALMWVADRVEEGLQHYRDEHAIAETWETRERVVVAVTGGPEGETLIRRAARIAERTGGGDLLAVHVARSDGLTGISPTALAHQRRLVESLGGSYHAVVGDHVPTALLDFARAEHATQLVLGVSRRGRLAQSLTGPGIGATVSRHSGDIDVHIVTHEHAAGGRRLPAGHADLSLRRRLAGALAVLVLLPALTVGLTGLRTVLTLPSQILSYLVVVIGVALVGGLYPALVAAIAASLLINYFFVPPIGSLTIAEPNNIVAVIVFLLVAAAVSAVVGLAARRTGQAARAAAEAETLSVLAGSVLRGEQALPALVARLRETFGMESVALLQRVTDQPDAARGSPEPAPAPTAFDGGGWITVACAGPSPCANPREADTIMAVGDTALLALRGRTLPATDQRVLAAFAAHTATTLEQQRLARGAAQARQLAELDRVRTALLAAVSHDLRTPLAAAKAAVSGLADPGVTWSDHDRAELLATADESLDRLTGLVHNLLDASRLQAGAMPVRVRAVALAELVPIALAELGPPGSAVVVDIPQDLPDVTADPELLQRVMVNITANALHHAPASSPILITASAFHDRVEIRVIDRGPGVPDDARDAIFVPFQRLGDTDNTTGIGLGLALSRGLTEAMGGTLTADHTPGGGLTMTLSLPAVAATTRTPVSGDESSPAEAG